MGRGKLGWCQGRRAGEGIQRGEKATPPPPPSIHHRGRVEACLGAHFSPGGPGIKPCIQQKREEGSQTGRLYIKCPFMVIKPINPTATGNKANKLELWAF